MQASPAGQWMATSAVRLRGVSISLACRTFQISESCYRYERKLGDKNAEIADWLVRLTTTHRTWGFGLCFLYLRNVKGYAWNHKRVRRIYRALELNLRIKPKKRLVREKPEPLAVPGGPNMTWSMRWPAGDACIAERGLHVRSVGRRAQLQDLERSGRLQSRGAGH